MLLKHCFEQLRSTQIAIVHCSAQTNPTHVLQKLGQTCMVLNTNTGRVYRPKDCERLVLYLKDINLPKPDKWGTCQLIAFLQQVMYGVKLILTSHHLNSKGLIVVVFLINKHDYQLVIVNPNKILGYIEITLLLFCWSVHLFCKHNS